MNEKPATRFPEPPPRFGYNHKTDGSPDFGLWLQGPCWLLHIGVDQPCGERQAVALTAGNEGHFSKTKI